MRFTTLFMRFCYVPVSNAPLLAADGVRVSEFVAVNNGSLRDESGNRTFRSEIRNVSYAGANPGLRSMSDSVAFAVR